LAKEADQFVQELKQKADEKVTQILQQVNETCGSAAANSTIISAVEELNQSRLSAHSPTHSTNNNKNSNSKLSSTTSPKDVNIRLTTNGDAVSSNNNNDKQQQQQASTTPVTKKDSKKTKTKDEPKKQPAKVEKGGKGSEKTKSKCGCVIS
jgi:hypothetical protein